MSDTKSKIEPALTPEEWRDVTAPYKQWPDLPLTHIIGNALEPIGDQIKGDPVPAVIALGNHALPDSDPRKITRDKVAAARRAVEVAELFVEDASDDDTRGTLVAALMDARQFADALESYLPPE